jgi:NAD(P)-dependent dehydrogenase (short-subunit alcohol dehydrogenase family)
MAQTMSFEGRVALVTGAASGIGLAVLRKLLALGARAVACDLHDTRLDDLDEADRRVVQAIADVADEQQAVAAVQQATKRFGRLDVLVNCAGIADVNQPTVEQDLATWQRIIDVNLRGTYLMTREAGRLMAPQRSGAIVNVSSIAGVVGLPRRNAYSAAKAGVAMMTRTLAAEWGPKRVRVNAVAPGYIRTSMVTDIEERGIVDLTPVRKRTPLGRLGEADEVAALIVFLASDLASYITGAVVPVDGGWSAFGGAGEAYTD